MDKDKAAAFIEEKRKEKGLTQQLPRQYMHNKENAVTMRLSAH